MSDESFQWAQGHDEDVEVNQRALIDKVLARYSGEFTGAHSCLIMIFTVSYYLSVFRELLQNSDDARARRVEIHFQTEAYYARQDSGVSSIPVAEDAEVQAAERLPDLKTAAVCYVHISCCSRRLTGPQVHHWIFKNDGDFFDDDGWSRLKKIGMLCVSCLGHMLIQCFQLRVIRTKRRSAHLVWVSIACFLSPKSLGSLLAVSAILA